MCWIFRNIKVDKKLLLSGHAKKITTHKQVQIFPVYKKNIRYNYPLASVRYHSILSVTVTTIHVYNIICYLSLAVTIVYVYNTIRHPSVTIVTVHVYYIQQWNRNRQKNKRKSRSYFEYFI